MRPATEADWLENVRALAKWGRWEMYHTFDARRSQPGFPDLVLLRPPVCLFREIKVAPRGRVSQAQRSWLDGLVACGCDAKCWVFPDDWEEAVTTLTGRGERR